MASWRKPNPHRPTTGRGVPALAPYPATRFFDQLCFIGDPNVCCFLVEGSEGLVLLDALNPDQRSLEIIERGIDDLGHSMDELKAILITHEHGDHFGVAGKLKKKYGCKVYMSKIADDFIHNIPSFMPWESVDYAVDGHLEDMGTFTLGDISITTVHTPGHSNGCMSFIIPVTDEGRSHKLSLWGGTGIMRDTDPDIYLASCDKFEEACRQAGVDGNISNHPFVDMMTQRLDIIRNIVDGVYNPFITGTTAEHYYMDMFRNMALAAKAKRQ